MTIRNLDYMFKPASVALIGADPDPVSLGGIIGRNLLGAGFESEIFLVGDTDEAIGNVPVFPDISALPKGPDLAVISAPPARVANSIARLGEMGARAAVVISAGAEAGYDSAVIEEMLAAARPHTLRIIGPNCLGVMVPGSFLNAGFGHVQPLPGRLAFVTQSGSVLTSVLDWANHRRIGFSHLISLGDMADVDFGDTLEYLANDSHTRAILLYIECITQTRKFMSAARAAARIKPVIVVKAGRCNDDRECGAVHWSARMGRDPVYDAAFRRAGMLRVSDMQALFDAVDTLSLTRSVPGDRLAILTNGGGIGMLAADTLCQKKGRLAALSPETLKCLEALLPSGGQPGNPVDITDNGDDRRYAEALECLLDDKGVDAVLVLRCPNALVPGVDVARAVIDTYQAESRGYSPKPTLLTCWLGEQSAVGARQFLADHRIPTYDTPDDAVRAFMQIVRFQHNREMLTETPPTDPERFTPDTAAARAVVLNSLKEGKHWLLEADAKAVLSAYKIPVAETHVAASPKEAEAIAARLGQTVALKILSPDVIHKTEVGGVCLDLESPALVRETASTMVERLLKILPHARIKGFTVQPMMRRKNAHELFVGMTDDPEFGPVIHFGHGGTAIEVIEDKALALPPLNMHLAREVMAQTRVFRLLEGYRGDPPADIDGVALTLIKVSQLVCDMAEIAELKINPLLTDHQGVMVLDARIRVVESDRHPSDRLAVCP
ncbi:MAG: acetate--CoA ligase family protein [Thermodesulfobacteriota bacterium]